MYLLGETKAASDLNCLEGLVKKAASPPQAARRGLCGPLC